MQDTDTDERAMERLARGDDGALAQLMNRWEGPVWCFIDRMCGATGTTDDVYQEVWTRIFLYRRRYSPRRPFRPYLFAVAVNCCRQALKGRRRAGLFASLDDDAGPTDPDPPPLENLIAGEQQEMLHRAVGRLPQAQRQVVLLYLLFSTDYGQIARVLGKSPGTVRSNMHHALGALRRSLSRIAFAPEGKVDHERQIN